MKTLDEIYVYPCIDWIMQDVYWTYKFFDEATAQQQFRSLPCDVIVGELRYVLHISLDCTIDQAEKAYQLHHEILEGLAKPVAQEVS